MRAQALQIWGGFRASIGSLSIDRLEQAWGANPQRKLGWTPHAFVWSDSGPSTINWRRRRSRRGRRRRRERRSTLPGKKNHLSADEKSPHSYYLSCPAETSGGGGGAVSSIYPHFFAHLFPTFTPPILFSDPQGPRSLFFARVVRESGEEDGGE